MGTRLTHIALHVDEIDQCIRFYERYCRLQVADDRERGGRRVVLLAEPGREDEFVLQLLGGGEDRPAAAESDRRPHCSQRARRRDAAPAPRRRPRAWGGPPTGRDS